MMMCNECSGHMNDVRWTQIDCQLLVGLLCRRHPPRHSGLLHQVGELRVGAPHVVLPLPQPQHAAQNPPAVDTHLQIFLLQMFLFKWVQTQVLKISITLKYLFNHSQSHKYFSITFKYFPHTLKKILNHKSFNIDIQYLPACWGRRPWPRPRWRWRRSCRGPSPRRCGRDHGRAPAARTRSSSSHPESWSGDTCCPEHEVIVRSGEVRSWFPSWYWQRARLFASCGDTAQLTNSLRRLSQF